MSRPFAPHVPQFDADRPLSEAERAKQWWSEATGRVRNTVKDRGDDLVDDLIERGRPIPGFINPMTDKPWTRSELLDEFDHGARQDFTPNAWEIVLALRTGGNWDAKLDAFWHHFGEWVKNQCEAVLVDIYRACMEGLNVPSGWVIVPIEPTESMLRDAADNLCGEFGADWVRPKEVFARAVWREFIAASPYPPTQEDK